VFTPECDVNAGAVPIVWLEGVQADDGAGWLAGLVRTKVDDRDWRARVGDAALSALALHPGDVSLRQLLALAREDSRSDVRGRALTALAQRAGQLPATAIVNAIDRDPEVEVKKTAVRALSQLPKDEGVPLLIQVARTNRTPEVRREAMLRLGQSNDPRAVRFFEQLLAP
jgi:HEAT repeat protein